MSHQDSKEKPISGITRPVALSLIFTNQVNQHWGIVPYSTEWCSETDPSILQHNRAPHQRLSRFSPTNHWDCHFREESLEKETFRTSKRPSISSHARNPETSDFSEIFLNFRGGRPATCALHCWAHFTIGLREFLKLHQWQITANWVLNLPRLERWRGGVFSVPVQCTTC